MKARSALLLAAVVLAPIAGAFRGASGPLRVGLNLGPGDGPYLSGFFPEYEIDQGTALHWSRPEAVLALPLTVSGPAELSLRFGPPPGGPSRVDVVLGERPLGGFDCCRHRALQRQRFDAPPTGARTPVRVGVRVTGPDVRDRGLFLDRIDLDLHAGARLNLTGAARFRGAALVGLVLVVLVLVGFALEGAALLVAPLAAVLTLGLLRDPWLVHRLLTQLPETLLLVVAPAAGLARVLVPRLLEARTLRTAATLATLAFLLRGAALHHPDFYYPDLMVHARLVAVAREAGVRLWLEPRVVLYTPRETPGPTDTLVRATSGLWLRRLLGVDVGLPYSLALHALLAPFARTLDGTVTLLKTAGALLSAVPIVVLAFLARRLGVSPWAAAGLLVAAPTAFVELSLGTVPAAFGHALDALFLLWLLHRGARASRPAIILEGALVLAAVQVAYVSSVLTASILLALLAVLSWRREPRVARGLLLCLALGSAFALAVYYRSFVQDALAALRLALGQTPLSPGPGGPARSDGGGRVDAALLLWAFPLVAVPAAFSFVRFAARPQGALVLAWGLATLLLGLLRALVPGVFSFLHVTLFATPLLALCAGAALSDLADRGTRGRLAASGLTVLAAVLGLALQARALLAQLGSAR